MARGARMEETKRRRARDSTELGLAGGAATGADVTLVFDGEESFVRSQADAATNTNPSGMELDESDSFMAGPPPGRLAGGGPRIHELSSLALAKDLMLITASSAAIPASG